MDRYRYESLHAVRPVASADVLFSLCFATRSATMILPRVFEHSFYARLCFCVGFIYVREVAQVK